MLPTRTMAAVVGRVGDGAAYDDVVEWTSSAPPPPAPPNPGPQTVKTPKIPSRTVRNPRKTPGKLRTRLHLLGGSWVTSESLSKMTCMLCCRKLLSEGALTGALDILWGEVCLALHGDKEPRKLLQCCEHALLLALGFCFPGQLKTRRKSRDLEILVGNLFAAKTVVWLHVYQHSRRARQVMCLLSEGHQHAVLGTSAAHIREFVGFLRKGLCFDNTCSDFSLYSFFARGFLYIGIARRTRATGGRIAGCIGRLFEHLLYTARVGLEESKKVRYRLARRSPAPKLLWLPIDVGTELLIRAKEAVAIKMLAPVANLGHGAKTGSKVRLKPRRRPVPWHRQQRQIGCVNDVWTQPQCA